MPWWKRGVIYHILVPSYFDTNGDGLGDLPGVTGKLPYLEWLGVDAVWLSPLYPSPMADMGYDISDFTDVNPRFGSLADFDTLVEEAHRRNIRVILDWVPNHSSSEHIWFKEARSSRDNPKRGWYIWHDPDPDGNPPTNWISVFGDSVWTFDDETEQYFLHTFLEEMPDLNWRNPGLALAHYDAMRFWMDRGVDGFRLDAIDMVIKDDQFRDNPPNPDFNPETDAPDMAVLSEFTRDQPFLHEVLAAMRRIVEEYDERVLAGELHLPVEKIVTYYGTDDAPELHLPLNLLFASAPWTPESIQGAVNEYMCHKPEDGAPCWLISSHDGQRITSRVGAEQARVAAMLLLTMPGTPVMYYGDEIGMHDVDIPPEREQDPQGKRIGRKRDPVRTPMQWNADPQAGFTSGEPWLPVADDYAQINVDGQDGRSLLALYRLLLALRRKNPSLHAGGYAPAYQDDHLLAYRRDGDGGTLLVILNFSGEPQTFAMDDHGGSGKVLLSTGLDRKDETVNQTLQLREHEGIIIQS